MKTLQEVLTDVMKRALTSAPQRPPKGAMEYEWQAFHRRADLWAQAQVKHLQEAVVEFQYRKEHSQDNGGQS